MLCRCTWTCEATTTPTAYQSATAPRTGSPTAMPYPRRVLGSTRSPCVARLPLVRPSPRTVIVVFYCFVVFCSSPLTGNPSRDRTVFCCFVASSPDQKCCITSLLTLSPRVARLPLVRRFHRPFVFCMCGMQVHAVPVCSEI